MKQILIGRRQSKWSPDRGFINEAISEFIKNGGTIKKIVLSDEDWKSYTQCVDRDADFYLREQERAMLLNQENEF